MIHSAETQKLLEALVAYVPEDQRPAFGDAAHAFLESLTIDYEAEFMDEAGAGEINAFTAAAAALVPLNSEMRDRVLRSLRALMLERGPSPLDRYMEIVAPLIPAIVQHYLQPAGHPASDPGTGHDGGQAEQPMMMMMPIALKLGEQAQLVVIWSDGKFFFQDGAGKRTPLSDEMQDLLVKQFGAKHE